MEYNLAENRMKRSIVIVVLMASLVCGTIFAMDYSSDKNNQKIEVNENAEDDVCDDCYTKKNRKNFGHDEIKVINRCSYAVTVTYEYWTDRWVPVIFDVDPGKESSWWPADDYRNFNCVKKK